jgi:glutaminyl-tRNA synthetase
LRYGYLITCNSVVKDAEGKVIELHCTYDPATKGGTTPDGRKVKSTIHWVSAKHAVDARFVFMTALLQRKTRVTLRRAKEFTANLNPNSVEVVSGCKVEASLIDAVAGTRYQFERLGYFTVDRDSTPGRPVFNKTIGLRDTWQKIEQRAKR